MTDTTVARLYEALVRAIRERHPGADAERTVTVAEVYQTLVPYRRVRGALGVDLNADYEHALMLLLAGAGEERVRLEPGRARAELRHELESRNPNVGLFRKFAACDVRVRLDASAAAPESSELEPGEDMEPGPETAGGDDSDPTPVTVATADAAAPERPASSRPPTGESSDHRSDDPDRGTPAESAPCAFCGQSLPAGRDAKYCPFCGADQRRRPCPECGEPIEAEWRFCIDCGHDIAAEHA